MGQQRVIGRIVGTVVLTAALAAGTLGSAVASPAPVPAPVARLVAESGHAAATSHHRSGSRQALRVGDADEEVAFLDLYPGCAKGSGKAKVAAAVVSARKLTLDYALTGAGGLHKTGKVTVKKNREKALKLPKVRRGGYRLVLTRHGSSAVVADATFDVLGCVRVTTACHAATFTNPAGNPTATLTYSGHKKRQSFTLALAPGESRTVRVDVARTDWSAYAVGGDPADVAVISGDVGHGTVKVKQKCRHEAARPGETAVQTVAVAGCATDASASAEVGLDWSSQASLRKRSWSVTSAAGDVVASGTYREHSSTTIRLPAGSYTYRSRANRASEPFETVAFRVLRCLGVTPVCRALRLDNVDDVAVTALVLPVGEGGEDDEELADEPGTDETVVAAHGSATVAETSGEALVLAFGGDGGDPTASTFVSLASAWSLDEDDDLDTYTVPQDC